MHAHLYPTLVPSESQREAMPSIAERLRALSRNMWWTWHPEVIALFREIDCAAWRAANHNSVAFLAAVPAQVIESRAEELELDGRIAHAFRRLEEYLEGKGAWADERPDLLACVRWPIPPRSSGCTRAFPSTPAGSGSWPATT